MRPISFSEKREIYRNQFLRLYSVRADFETFQKEYFITEKGKRVGVLLCRDGSVLLVRQYRYLVNGWSWEIPGGGVGEESLEDAAVRECREEAGCECRRLSPLFDCPTGTDVTDSHMHIFSCSDFLDLGMAGNQETDARRWLPLREGVEMALDGEIKDVMTILALLVFSRKVESSPPESS